MILPYKSIYPVMHESVFCVESAGVIGDVTVGKDSSIWFNAVVRGDVHYIRIGERTNIQDNCTLHVTHDTHPLVLGDNITVGHGVTLHGCTIEDRCLIGMGATVLDGAVVGADSMIGAGALVTESMNVPPGSLVVGVPGKVKRTLSEKEKAGILQSAANYIGYVSEYNNG